MRVYKSVTKKMKKYCEWCKSEYIDTHYQKARKFCSRRCFYEFIKKNPSKTSFKYRPIRMFGKKNPNYKEVLTYRGIHKWVVRTLGKANKCEKCGNTDSKRYEWANISKKYKRDVHDWMSLCKKCHNLYDNHYKKMWITRRYKKTIEKKGEFYRCEHKMIGNDIQFLIRTCPKCSQKLTVKNDNGNP